MLAIILAILAAAPPSADKGALGIAMAPEDLWLLAQARNWLLGAEEWRGDVAAGLVGAPALAPTDPVMSEIKPLLESIATEEPEGIVSTGGRGSIPRPGWKFAWRDVDGDAEREIVLAAGTSPAPFYAIFQRAPDGHSWKVLHKAQSRFLGTAMNGGHAHFFGGFDGYGIAGPSLSVESIEKGSGKKTSLTIFLSSQPGGRPAPGAVVPVTTTRTTKLRGTPEKDDTPVDSGMGGVLFPGNLFRTLAGNSTGWILDVQKGKDGQDWAFCCFVGNATINAEHPLKDLSTPRKLSRMPLSSAESLIAGWVLARDLARR